jgi:polysaccharide biosynthesis/export protein
VAVNIVSKKSHIYFCSADRYVDEENKMKLILIALSLMLSNSIIALPFQKTTPSSPSPAVPLEFAIGFEDVLAINVWKEPEFTVKEVVVRPDGKISLPLIGDVIANGLTTKQLQDRITERLKEFIAAPSVTVVVLKVASQFVSLVGKVGKPGPFYLGSPLTVLELLSRAGGFSEEANVKKIMIIRKDGTKFFFNYKEVASGKNLQQNIVLKSGDMVVVP